MQNEGEHIQIKKTSWLRIVRKLSYLHANVNFGAGTTTPQRACEHDDVILDFYMSNHWLVVCVQL